MSAICQRDHPWGIPKQDDSVLGTVWCLTFPAKSALETKIRSPISRKSLVVSTWNFACEFLLTLSISWKKITAIRKSHFSLQEYLKKYLLLYINTTISYTCEWNNLLCEAERIYICNVCYILHSKLQEAGDYNFYTSLHAISRFCSPNLKVIFVGALSKETNIGVSGNIASGNIISDNGMFIH